MIFVLPMIDQLRGEFSGLPRLYAYPRVPDIADAPFVILDSGAFGLFRKGGSIDSQHMEKLDRHYRKYAGTSSPVAAVAPDEFLNPDATMLNWSEWHSKCRARVQPVIQFARVGRCDCKSLRKQETIYRGCDWLFVSNPSLTGQQAKERGFANIISGLRSRINPKWVHILGAGWSVDDVLHWSKIPGIDSIDSISYYEKSQQGIAFWKENSDWKELAVNNGLALSFAAQGIKVSND